MELYSVYRVIFLFALISTDGYVSARVFIAAAAVAVAVWLALFILQGVGLYKMAKNVGLRNKWLAFVPFGDLFFMGKLSGSSEIFGRKMKRPGLYAMLASIGSSVFCIAAAVAEALLFTKYGSFIVENEQGYQWVNLSGFGLYVYNFYRFSDFFIGIFELVYIILLLILLMGLYKRYYAKGYLLLSWLGLFLPVSRYIVVFVLRKNKNRPYEEYLRQRREEFLRRQSQNPYGAYGPYGPYGSYGPYGGANGPYNNPNGPYGGQSGPYNNPGNPYGGQSGYGQNPQSGRGPAEDPFSEFAPGASSGSGPAAGSNGDSSKPDSRPEDGGHDDLFN